ncbi:MAG: hypothetical protein K0R05_3528 [Anaerocolumna sp.]|jgi:hypothetical protein|nr:hypothetical protein [Anaerocolumna sp.]
MIVEYNYVMASIIPQIKNFGLYEKGNRIYKSYCFVIKILVDSLT